VHVVECPVEPRASPVQPAAAETAAAAEQSLAKLAHRVVQAGLFMNGHEIAGNRKQLKGWSIWAASVAALVTLTAAGSLAFITVAQAQQQPKKPAAPAARPAPPPRAVSLQVGNGPKVDLSGNLTN
jgi:hypothetical protein